MFGAKTSPTGQKLDGIDMQSYFATSPETGEQYEFDNSVLAGGDWSGTFDNYDGAFTPEQIQKYYDIAIDMDWENEWYSTPDMKADKNRVGYKHISLGGSDTERVDYEIEQDWVKEIWDEINPGLKLIRHYLNGHGPHQSGGIHVDGWTGNQYTVIVYLTPDMTPEDGGSLEVWTPNITEEMKAIAFNTPFGFGREKETDVQISKSYWPKPGRYVVLDARLPHVARAVENDKFRVSLVFKGTTLGAPKSDETEFTEVE